NVLETVAVVREHPHSSSLAAVDAAGICPGQRELSHRLTRPWLYIEAFYNLTSAGRRAKACLNQGYKLMDEVVEQRKEILRSEARSSLMKGIDKKSEDMPNVPPTTETDADANKKQHNILIDSLLQEHGRKRICNVALENGHSVSQS
ncbi:Protein of unknown function, partial [Gryllus bimaculatus]